MKRQRTKARRLTHSIRYDPRDLNRRIVVPMSPARSRVVLTRIDTDVLASKAGATVGCLNSNCAMREAAKGKFPHPVHLAEFSKTSAWVVDRLDKNGQPAHCVWYAHNDPASVALNDRIVKRQTLLTTIDLQKSLILRPPIRRNGFKNPYANGTHPQAARDARTGRRQVNVLRGAMQRAKAAGLLVLQA